MLVQRLIPQPGGPGYLYSSDLSPLILYGKGESTTSYATAGIALGILKARKPNIPVQSTFFKAESIGRPQELAKVRYIYGHE
jgi:hypothetical protein